MTDNYYTGARSSLLDSEDSNQSGDEIYNRRFKRYSNSSSKRDETNLSKVKRDETTSSKSSTGCSDKENEPKVTKMKEPKIEAKSLGKSSSNRSNYYSQRSFGRNYGNSLDVGTSKYGNSISKNSNYVTKRKRVQDRNCTSSTSTSKRFKG